jgi:Tfp pilus assembly protein PilX
MMRRSNGQSGKRAVVLILVIFAIAFITVLAVAVLDDVATDLMILRNHLYGPRALYAAQAGVNEALGALRLNSAAGGTVSGTLSLPDGSTSTYSATITNAYPIATITSTGQANGFTRKVKVRAQVAGAPAMASPYPVRVALWQEVIGP